MLLTLDLALTQPRNLSTTIGKYPVYKEEAERKLPDDYLANIKHPYMYLHFIQNINKI